MLYELATLSCPLPSVGEAVEGVRRWVADPEAKGALVGCWRSEIGALGQVLVLRGFEQPEDMTAERRRALMSASPFHAGTVATGLAMESYAPFPFLPPIRTGARGGIYEFRAYRLKLGGLSPTMAAWEAAVPGAGDYATHLVVNMYALDGPPRITHVWAFADLNERARLRGAAFASGVWPPKGGPQQIAEAASVIGLPEGFSPLR
jgi:hypothetical protein